MPIVTALKRQQRNKERVNVYLDDDFALGLHELDAAQLRLGQELTQAQIAELRERDAVNQAFERGITLLSFRPRSTQEIRQNLTRHGITEPIADAAIQRLQDMGYLDDVAFARFWVENRTQFKPRGASALRYELAQKGISRDIADPIIAEIVDEFDAALTVAHKQCRRYRGISQREFQTKLSAFLQRRGFRYETVRQVLDHLMPILHDEDEAFFLSEDEA